MNTSIELLDVSARDGLQNEARLFSVEEKLRLIHSVLSAGIRRIEVASFVNPKRVPQMADAEALIARLPEDEAATFVGLVLNERGLDRALETRIDEIGCVVLTTDTFARRNQGQTCRESVDVARTILKRSRQEGRSANVTISAAFGCPFEGEVPIERVVDIAVELADETPREIAIADTIGVADPWHVDALFTALRDALPDMPLRAHFHNTRNTGLANAYAAVKAGVRTLDGSVGGIGGCPFAPAATGNVPTEDLLYMLQRNGACAGLSLGVLIETAKWLEGRFGRQLPGMVSRAGPFPGDNNTTKTTAYGAETK